MQHVILGRGNLGQALNGAIYRKTGRSPIVLNRAEVHMIDIKDNENVWFWNTEGFGSVGECKKDPVGAFDCHVRRVHDLIHKFPRSNIICFSTNYVSVDNAIGERNLASHYSVTKALMEELVLMESRNKKNLWAVRVANLYSKYKPWDSFAGRLLKAHKNGNPISLPLNTMIPTDTDWLANQLIENLDNFQGKEPILGLAPNDVVTTHHFGQFVLGTYLSVSQDKDRPMDARIENSFEVTETWYDVFNQAVDYRLPLGLGSYI